MTILDRVWRGRRRSLPPAVDDITLDRGAWDDAELAALLEEVRRDRSFDGRPAAPAAGSAGPSAEVVLRTLDAALAASGSRASRAAA